MLGERRHPDRLVSRVERAHGPVVVKEYAVADATQVFADMCALWESSFGGGRSSPGMPEPLACDGSTIEMQWIDGVTLGVRGEPGSTSHRIEDVAKLLADLHDSGALVRRNRRAAKLLRSLHRKAELMAVGLRDQFASVLTAVAAVAPPDGALVVGHGDFSPRNILVAAPDARLVLIDFDRLQMADRGRDLGYMGAWVWATEFIAHGSADWSFADELLCHYRAIASADVGAANMDACAFFRASALLRIAQSWSSLVDRQDLASELLAEAQRLVSRGAR